MIAIDLGSNTLQCVEYDCVSRQWGRAAERIVRTADGLHESGRISEDAIRRIVNALNGLKEQMHFEATETAAVATAAMRMASNSAEALEAIRFATGVQFRVIDAEAEALYTLAAVRNRLEALGRCSDSFVLIDIGGGSSEVIVNHGGRVETKSFPVGIVTTAQQCETSEEIRGFLRRELEAVRAFIEPLYAEHGKPGSLIATAGTPTTVASYLCGMTYANYDAERINGFVLDRAACTKALRALLAMEENERALYVGVGREDLIVAGIVIVELFYDLLGFERSVVVNDGVREGVALEHCSKRSAG
jgi:exopolyphosphatase/guanosine-5'-triphosphate,3'-diphosphate pyrophosphatase